MPPASGHRARLRARFLKAGFDGFAEHEVLELLLTLAIPLRDVKPQAKALLERFGGLRAALEAPPAEIRRIAGLGESAIVALRVIREASTLYLHQVAESRDQFLDFGSLERYWRARMGHLSHEEFDVAYLDSAHRLLKDGVECLEVGLPNQALVYPRKVMESALRRGATALIVAHNHPSGEAWPSAQDKELTRALQSAANALQIRFLDHAVVTRDAVFSFRREGLL